MTPYRGQQVHQAFLDPFELLGQMRRPLPETLDALALEARVVGHDPARARARRDHGFGECRSRILRPVGDPLMMHPRSRLAWYATTRPPPRHVATTPSASAGRGSSGPSAIH